MIIPKDDTLLVSIESLDGSRSVHSAAQVGKVDRPATVDVPRGSNTAKASTFRKLKTLQKMDSGSFFAQ